MPPPMVCGISPRSALVPLQLQTILITGDRQLALGPRHPRRIPMGGSKASSSTGFHQNIAVQAVKAFLNRDSSHHNPAHERRDAGHQSLPPIPIRNTAPSSFRNRPLAAPASRPG